MIFSKKNAGKWVVSSGNTIIATSKDLNVLVKKVGKRDDKKSLRFDKVPTGLFIGAHYGI